MTEPNIPRLSVDIVSDVMCPWCIIGWLKFQAVLAHFEGRLNFRVQWHPFELNPDMPPEGEDAAEHVMRKYGITAEQSRANSGKMAGVAANLGFVFNRGPDFRMRNSFDAHRLLTWAGALEEPEQAAAIGVQTALKLVYVVTAERTIEREIDVVDMRCGVGIVTLIVVTGVIFSGSFLAVVFRFHDTHVGVITMRLTGNIVFGDHFVFSVFLGCRLRFVRGFDFLGRRFFGVFGRNLFGRFLGGSILSGGFFGRGLFRYWCFLGRRRFSRSFFGCRLFSWCVFNRSLGSRCLFGCGVLSRGCLNRGFVSRGRVDLGFGCGRVSFSRCLFRRWRFSRRGFGFGLRRFRRSC